MSPALGRYEHRVWEYDPKMIDAGRVIDERAAMRRLYLYPSNLSTSPYPGRSLPRSPRRKSIVKPNAASQATLALFALFLLRTESIASSKVEGMQVDARILARAEAAGDVGQRVTPSALEVLGNIDAMMLAIENAAAEESVGIEEIVEVHRALLINAPNSHIAGRIRSEQNWIGGNEHNPCDAAFVPPPPEEVEALLGDLCRFCNSDRLPVIVQAAIAHAQFETIHPFADGNGRTGRDLCRSSFAVGSLRQPFPSDQCRSRGKQGPIYQWLDGISARSDRSLARSFRDLCDSSRQTRQALSARGRGAAGSLAPNGSRHGTNTQRRCGVETHRCSAGSASHHPAYGSR